MSKATIKVTKVVLDKYEQEIEDLIKVKAKAKRNGIAYQTLISLLIRQYIKGESAVILD